MKQKNMGKAVAVLMCMAMVTTLFTAPISANACVQEVETETEAVVMPRTAACPHCGDSIGRHTSTAWADWYRTGVQRTCDRYPWGVDLERRRDGVETVICAQCGVKISSTNISQTEWECHGFE